MSGTSNQNVQTTAKPNIVFLDDYAFEDIDCHTLESLGHVKSYSNTKQNEVIQRCQNAQVVLTNKVIIDKAVMDSCPNLKLIVITATGMNNVDLDCAKSKNIVVKNAIGYSSHSVSQHTLAMVLSLNNNLNALDNYSKNGSWSSSGRFSHWGKSILELNTSTWGIIGLGAIGQEVARLASSFGAKVCTHSPSGLNYQSQYNQIQDLEQFLQTCDIITIHSPLNQYTKDLIGTQELSLLKDNAILVNVARGGIINEDAIANALHQRQNIYIGLDVLTQEPPKPDHALLQIRSKNLLITPHSAWTTTQARQKLMDISTQNIADFLNQH